MEPSLASHSVGPAASFNDCIDLLHTLFDLAPKDSPDPTRGFESLKRSVWHTTAQLQQNRHGQLNRD